MQPVIIALTGLLALFPAAAGNSATSEKPQTSPATQPSGTEVKPPPSGRGRQEARRRRLAGPRGAPQREAQAVDLLKEVLGANGGEDYLRGLGSLFVRSRHITGQGLEAREMIITVYWKHPNLYRREMEGPQGLSTMAFNGRYGWHDLAETGGGVTIAPRASNSYFDDLVRDMNEPLSHLDETNHISYEGESELEGRKVEVVRVVRTSGKVKTLYIDPETHFILQKEVSKYSEPDAVVARRRFSDFRQIDRMWVPYLEEVLTSDTGGRVEVVDFIPNQAIDNSVFDSPLPPMDETEGR